MKNMTLRGLVFIAACTLCVASFASVHVPCKSGQKPVQKGVALCTPAAKNRVAAKTPVRTLARAKTTTRGKAAPRTLVHSKLTGRGKVANRTKAGARVAYSAAIIAMAPTVSEMPQSTAIVDCESTQILAQGGAAQCPALAMPNGSATLTQTNPGTSCFAALSESHATRQLASKVPFLSGSAASPEVLANSAVPNRMEKEELGSVMAGYSVCLDMAASWRRQAYTPAVVNALNAYWHTAQSILSELATGKRTYGDAARAIADNDQAYKRKIDAL